MDKSKPMRYMVWDGVQPATTDDMPPGLVAEVDQVITGIDEIITRLTACHVAVILATEDDDMDEARAAVGRAMDICMNLERPTALSVLNTLASTAARHFIADHGGPAAMTARLEAREDSCCDRHAEEAGPVDPFTG